MFVLQSWHKTTTKNPGSAVPVQEGRGAMHQVSESSRAYVGLAGGGGLAFLVLTDYFISGFMTLSSSELAL